MKGALERESAAFQMHAQGKSMREIGRALGRHDDSSRSVSPERARQLVNRAFRRKRAARIRELKDAGVGSVVALDRACREIDGTEPFMVTIWVPPEKRLRERDEITRAWKLHDADAKAARRQAEAILRWSFRTETGKGSRAEILKVEHVPDGTREEDYYPVAGISPDHAPDGGAPR